MLKKILYAVIGLLVLLVIIGFLLPAKIELSRSTSINAPPEYSFEEVNKLENWKNWSYWNTLDSSMKVTYGEKNFGEGGWYSWESNELGNGKLLITESIPYSSIKADLDFMENGTAKAWYNFEPNGDSTRVTMGFSTDFGMNPVMRLLGATMMESEMNKAFDYNLTKLKTIAEAKPKFGIKVTEEQVEPVSYIGIKKTVSTKNAAAMTAEIGKMYFELDAVLKKAKVEMNGHPFCIFPKMSEESMDVVCAMPVDKDAKLPAKYPMQELPGGKAVKTRHLGSYDKLTATHDELNRYLSYRGYEVNGAPWEVYLTDPYVEKDTSRWITEVYYPVK